jgi:hypothetical protein
LIFLEGQLKELLMDAALDTDNCNRDQHLKSLESKHNKILHVEGVKWRLQSRAIWLKSGDAIWGPLCFRDVETVIHIFVSCSFCQDVWMRVNKEIDSLVVWEGRSLTDCLEI